MLSVLDWEAPGLRARSSLYLSKDLSYRAFRKHKFLCRLISHFSILTEFEKETDIFTMKTLICFALSVSWAFASLHPMRLRPEGGRIVGGQPAQVGQFPHQVSIQLSFFGHNCGGSILDASTILTTGSCCVYDPNQLEVVAGIIYLDTESDTKQRALVSDVIINEDYESQTFENDICLMKLENPLDINGESVAEATLPLNDDGSEEAGEPAIITGWGTLDEDDVDTPVFLRWVEVPIVDQDECTEIYGDILKDGMICAGETGKDACRGDAGGPMLCGDPEDRILCGIDSWVSRASHEATACLQY